MRKIVVAVALTITGVVLLFSYRTSTDHGTLPASGLAANNVPPAPAPAAGGNTAGNNSGNRTVDGGVADTPYGPMQVQISVTNGKIVSVNVLQEPDATGHDLRINSYAIPILNQEAVSAQSAHIDAVSGATYTSEGYVSSLQSAIDAAHLS